MKQNDAGTCQSERHKTDTEAFSEGSWLICGGRDYIDTPQFEAVMQALIKRRGKPARIIDGGARGADMPSHKDSTNA